MPKPTTLAGTIASALHATCALSWTELASTLSGEHFTLTNINKRMLRLKKDPWAGFEQVKQQLPSVTRAQR